MSGARLRAALAGAAFGLVTVLGMVGGALGAPQAGGEGANRVGIVVDTGSGTLTRCVTFPEASITGLEALQRSGLGPVVRSFSGQGGAVCAINGVGCPADSSCLSCQAPDYWAYHRADAGTGGFTYSQAGAGSTSVTDGDVEGWRWGTGSAPGFRAIDEVCPIAPPPTTPPPPASSTPPSSGGSPPPPPPDSGGGDTPPAGTTPAGGTTVAPTTTAASATTEPSTESSSDDGTVTDLDTDEAAARLAPDDDTGGSFPWLGVTAVAAVLGVVGWRVRVARRP